MYIGLILYLPLSAIHFRLEMWALIFLPSLKPACSIAIINTRNTSLSTFVSTLPAYDINVNFPSYLLSCRSCASCRYTDVFQSDIHSSVFHSELHMLGNTSHRFSRALLPSLFTYLSCTLIYLPYLALLWKPTFKYLHSSFPL